MEGTLKRFTLLALTAALAGCKFATMVSSGGYVQSLSNTMNCHGPDYCETEITDPAFNETFTAVARPGYEFVKWQDGEGFLCGGSTNPVCVVALTGGEQGAAVVATSATASIRPLFMDVGGVVDTDGDGTPDESDWDDDNDGIYDGGDNCPFEGPDLDGYGCPSNPGWEDNAVLIGDKRWAQPSQFDGVSWHDINAACPPPTHVCSGQLRLLDVTGWTWASTADVIDLLNSFMGTSLSDPSEVIEVFGTTYLNPVLFYYLISQGDDAVYLWAWTRDEVNIVEAYQHGARCGGLYDEGQGANCSGLRVGARNEGYPYGAPWPKTEPGFGAWLYQVE